MANDTTETIAHVKDSDHLIVPRMFTSEEAHGHVTLPQPFQLDEPIAAAELTLPQYYQDYPPITEAGALPTYPAVERDISAIVSEQVRWEDLDRAVRELNIEVLEAVEFVMTFRGKQIGKDRKSVTLRLRFRAADRTLTNEDVDGHVAKMVAAIQSRLDAEIRE